MVIIWSAPATDSMLATSFAEIGARLYKLTSRRENDETRRSRGKFMRTLPFNATHYLPPYMPHVGPLDPDPVTFKEATLFTCKWVH